MKKKLIGLSLVFSLAIAGATIPTQAPTYAETKLGGVSVYNACKYQYTAAYHWEVFLKENNVMGWRCHLNHIKSGSVEINLNTECAREYGRGAKARYTNFNDPYSWYCAR